MSEPVPSRTPIRIMPPAIAQRIAAGEVIQRPTSILRELIENALDAGARTIDVEWRGAGLELITVSDNGQGIAAEDLPLAFQRHGTSKVHAADDLDRIITLGFRGEALPSIAAVALVEVTTRTAEREVAAHMVLQDGVVLQEGRIARTEGTTVKVRELFSALPVRRSFLPSGRAETTLALTLLRRYVLARPEVRFSLKMDGRISLRAAGMGEASALSTVFAHAARRLQPLEPIEAGGARITGYLGDPGLTRADREGLLIIVNGRWVQPQRWLAALESAYRPLMPRGRHPVAVLYVALDPTLVDVNVHPAKLEVRIVQEEETLPVLAAAVKRALGRAPSEAGGLLTSSLGLARQRTLTAARSMLAEDTAAYNAEAPSYGHLRIIAQVRSRMILAEDEHALYLIDQHRADERALYERLTQGAQTSGAQELLEPLSLELRPEQEASMAAALPEMERIGFRCERFGRRVFLIRTAPSGMPVESAAGLVQAIDGGVLEGSDWQERLRAAVACHSAVRRGVPLQEEQMRTLLLALDRCEVQTVCPHGSPIVARFNDRELARHFDWS